ncbi:aspartate/glutamate racemase family protein [Brevibacillus marinus]|uniref:aspartate/glutamate racemase family protein n=1 Tax=Brevibacillus marinus TaxID=2496837 RepID=UPI000F82BF0B|nr:aspartate/glutamate racemase family protein [Brevibacillus marinus]
MGGKPVKIGLIHATLNSLQPIVDAFQELSPQVKLLHFMDEGLIDALNETGEVTPPMVRRLIHLVEKAEESGVDGILLTCSSFSPFVNDIRPFFRTPLLAADISMLEEAVERGERIGVIATVAAAGPTTTALLKEIAAERGKTVDVQTAVITDAFAALQAGRPQQHNELIQRKITELAATCDVIVLAQMSMTRAVKGMPPVRVPVLTSPQISAKAILAKVADR